MLAAVVVGISTLCALKKKEHQHEREKSQQKLQRQECTWENWQMAMCTQQRKPWKLLMKPEHFLSSNPWTLVICTFPWCVGKGRMLTLVFNCKCVQHPDCRSQVMQVSHWNLFLLNQETLFWLMLCYIIVQHCTVRQNILATLLRKRNQFDRKRNKHTSI